MSIVGEATNATQTRKRAAGPASRVRSPFELVAHLGAAPVRRSGEPSSPDESPPPSSFLKRTPASVRPGALARGLGRRLADAVCNLACTSSPVRRGERARLSEEGKGQCQLGSRVVVARENLAVGPALGGPETYL